MSKKKEAVISYLLVLFGAAVYISLVFNYNVWLDEAFTATLIKTDMAGVIERSMNDTLPPLYNILLKITTDIFGYTVPVMKLTSVLPMILTMIISATTIRKRHGFLVSAVFTVCLFTMPNLLFYGVEIRMYSLGFFFATASAVYGYECICESSRKNWAVFVIVSVLAGYSHHFAFVAAGFVYLILLLYYLIFDRKNIKRFAYCLIVTFVLYLPCLITTIRQIKSVSGYFSMPDVTLPVFVKYCIYPYIAGNKAASALLALSVLFMAAAGIVTLVKEYKGCGTCKRLDLLYALCLFASYYGILLFGTVISKIMTANIFVDRYLLFAHGFIWLFFAVSLKDKSKNTVIFACIVIIFAGVTGYVKEYDIEYSTSPDALDDFLEKNVRDGDVLYTIEDDEELAYCLPFYENKLISYDDINKAVTAADNNNIWVAVMDYNGGSGNLPEIDGLSYETEYIGEFEFDRYNFSLYKIYTN